MLPAYSVRCPDRCGSDTAVGDVRSRLRTLVIVVLLLAGIATLPALATTAGADPQTVTLATDDLTPFVTTHDGVKSGFTDRAVGRDRQTRGLVHQYLDAGGATQQLDAVRTGAADAAASAISVTANRVENFDFSQPILTRRTPDPHPLRIDAQVHARTDRLPQAAVLLVDAGLAGAAFVITVIPAHITWLVERRHADSMVSKSVLPRLCCRRSGGGCGALAAQADEAPRHWLARAMGVLCGLRQHHLRRLLHRDPDRQPDGRALR